MDLFATAGVELPRSGASSTRTPAPRTLRVPLFAWKVLEEERRKLLFAPTPAQRKAAADYAARARKAFGRQKEEAVRPILFAEILQTILGYRTMDPERAYSLAFERPIRRGRVDVALGRFHEAEGLNEIVAPFELKGPATRDLDAPMPGRGRSPVQQAWDYAIDAPGAKWVLVSNCLEIRLYGFGRGRDAYEVFDLARLDDEEEHARLWMMLSAERLNAGALDRMLRDTDGAYRDVTEALYRDYKALRGRLIDFMVNAADGPRLTRLAAIEPSQKILDRVLFIAFAQRTDLLPDRLLERAAKAINEFDPRPLWSNFTALFRAVDQGDTRLQVWPYNGGLFAHDAVADATVLPDELAGEIASLGSWDYRREVPVTLLGHIFEQSITDIERLKAEGSGQDAPGVTRRKREGVVYTPDMVTRFLVEKTIGLSLREAFDAAFARHHMGETASGETQIAFWRDYLETLRAFAIVDPACGSGAFLVAAFDALAAEYVRAEKALAALGEKLDFDAFDEIVSKNLYGVDLNAESVEITRLSLWLKTARRGHRLQSLETTIRIGDSLIEDPAFTARPFRWEEAFPEIIARGGFDVVIGNPPYVRMELIKAVKPYLEKNYAVAADRADLYAYFYERGLGLLKKQCRLGFISSSTFFRTGSGENLRRYLSERGSVETLVDFGDTQIFEGVTTYPAIVVLREGVAPGEVAYFVVVGAAPKDLSVAFREGAKPMGRSRLGSGAWRAEDERLAAVRDKIATGRRTLGEVYGAPLYGIKTGLNEAFVIDTPTHDRLVRADPKSSELLKPFLRGEDLKRWRVEPEGLWLINTPKGKVRIDDYPAIRDWLSSFRAELEQRATNQEWFELQQAQLAYQPAFSRPKIVYQDITSLSPFSLDDGSFYLANTCYFLNHAEWELLAYINCSLSWFFFTSITNIARGGYYRLRSDFVEKLPIPEIPPKSRERLATLAQTCTNAARARFDVQSAVRRRILDLAPPERAKLTGRLEQWHELGFAAFRTEVKRAFRSEIPVKERGQWEAYLAENGVRVRSLGDAIAAAEREIDAIVYRLFDLSPEEITLLEESLAGQS